MMLRILSIDDAAHTENRCDAAHSKYKCSAYEIDDAAHTEYKYESSIAILFSAPYFYGPTEERGGKIHFQNQS